MTPPVAKGSGQFRVNFRMSTPVLEFEVSEYRVMGGINSLIIYNLYQKSQNPVMAIMVDMNSNLLCHKLGNESSW